MKDLNCYNTIDLKLKMKAGSKVYSSTEAKKVQKRNPDEAHLLNMRQIDEYIFDKAEQPKVNDESKSIDWSFDKNEQYNGGSNIILNLCSLQNKLEVCQYKSP